MSKNCLDLLKSLNIKVINPALYIAAFTHTSYKNEHKSENPEDYDRLEFIGDGVLDLIVADMAYHRFPKMRSGELSKCRSSLVMGTTLSKLAAQMNFGDYIRVSKGEASSGEIRNKILEDVFEAFIGAYYLDNHNDFEKTRKLVVAFFQDAMENYKALETFDYKSKLQELLQEQKNAVISYVVTKEEGTPQDKFFEIVVKCNGVILGTGVGSSKKKAEQDAAKNALERKV